MLVKDSLHPLHFSSRSSYAGFYFLIVLFYIAVKVLVFLTMPVEASSNDITQQIEYLWALKSSITSGNTITVVVSLLESPLENLEW